MLSHTSLLLARITSRVRIHNTYVKSRWLCDALYAATIGSYFFFSDPLIGGTVAIVGGFVSLAIHGAIAADLNGSNIIPLNNRPIMSRTMLSPAPVSDIVSVLKFTNNNIDLAESLIIESIIRQDGKVSVNDPVAFQRDLEELLKMDGKKKKTEEL